MTLFEQPPIVDLHDILDEVEADDARPTRIQWVLLVVAGILGVAGLLTVLAVTAPAILDVVSWITSIQRAVTP